VDRVRKAADARFCESVESGHSDQAESARIATLLGIAGEPYRIDSQCKYAAVARGDASIYLRVPRGDYRENVWDHAAGLIVVEEAGGRVSDVEGKPFNITTGRRMTGNRGAVVTAASIHDEVLAAQRALRLLRERPEPPVAARDVLPGIHAAIAAMTRVSACPATSAARR